MRFNKLPSQIIGLEDVYEAFCFNEACEYLLTRLEKKEKPIFKDTKKSKADVRKENNALADRLRAEKRGG